VKKQIKNIQVKQKTEQDKQEKEKLALKLKELGI